MNIDMATLTFISQIILVFAAVATTAFPVLYSFAPWYQSGLGQMIMLQSIALAAAIDAKFALTFVIDVRNREYLLIANDALLVVITGTSGTLTYLLWTFRRKSRNRGD